MNRHYINITRQMLKSNRFLPIVVGLFAIISFYCSSNQEVTKPAPVQIPNEASYQLDSVKLRSSIEMNSRAIAKQLEVSTLYGVDSILSDGEAVGKLLDVARKHYSDALSFQKSGNQDSSTIEFESAIDVLNNLSYYPDIENDTDFVALSKNIIGDYQKYISTVQNLGPGKSVFALQEKLSETVDSINVTGKQFPKEKTSKTTIPLDMNKYVEQNLEFFTTRGRWYLQNWIYRSGIYMPMMKKIFKDYRLPPELAYLSMPESGLNPTGRSWARAVGLWQFTRGTGSLYGLRTNWWYDERRDPVKATGAAAEYLRDLYDRYGDWYLVLASYDCGSVERAIRRSHGKRDFWEIKRHLPREAKNYVPQYIAVTLITMNPKEYGFDDSVAPVAAACDTVMIPESIDLKVLAEACGADLDSLLELNPELVHAVTPPNFSGEGYPLRVPAGMGKVFAQSYKSLPESAKLTWTFHTVRYGETLSGIASRYGVRLVSLKLANDFSRRTRRVRPGTTLMIPVNSSYYRHREPPTEIEHVVSREQPRSNDGTRSSIHIVERGETLSSIAEDYGTTVADLKRVNHLRRSAIKPRMRLHIIANSSNAVHDTSESQTAPTTSVASNAKLKSPLATSVFYHRVLRYENLNKIAAFYGVNISDLKRWNHLVSNRVRSGQRLRVMPPSVADQKSTPTAKPSATDGNNMLAESQDPDSKMIYRVRRGDSLWSIAKKFRVSMNKLREWNDNAGDIRPGQRIIIYN